MDLFLFFMRKLSLGRVITLSPSFHPQSLVSILLAASWVFSFQPVLPPDWRPLSLVNDEVGQALDAVTGTRYWAWLSFLIFLLCSPRNRGLAVVQWSVNFPAHPEMM